MSHTPSEGKELTTEIDLELRESIRRFNTACWAVLLGLMGTLLIAILAFNLSKYILAGVLGPFADIIFRIAPAAVIFYYFYRILLYFKESNLKYNPSESVIYTRNIPFLGRKAAISTCGIRTITRFYLYCISFAVWIWFFRTLYSDRNNLKDRLAYLYDNVEWINESSSAVVAIFLPSSIAQAGLELFFIVGTFLFVYLIAASVLVLSEEIIDNLRREPLSRILAIPIVSYILIHQVLHLWKLVLAASIGIVLNLALYHQIISFAVFFVCISQNHEGLGFLKCIFI